MDLSKADDYELDQVLRRHEIYDTLSPLEDLIRVNPQQLRPVLRLAMLYGMHAGHKQAALGVRYADIEREVESRVTRFGFPR